MPEAVVEDHGPERLEAALDLLEPRRGALQPVGGADVVHQEAVDGPHQRLVVEVLGEQHGVPRGEAAVAADVEVPAGFGGDHADVLAAGLGALARAAGDAELDLVRRAQAAVAQLELRRPCRPSPARRSGTRSSRRRTSRCAATCRRRGRTRSRRRRAAARSSGSCSSRAPNMSIRWPPVIFV